LGFVPGYICAFILKKLGMLRVPAAAEVAGLDTVKVPAQGYPEGIAPSGPASS
jgi:ammonia channel protein AmtB